MCKLYRKQTNLLQALLPLERNPVGIRFLWNKQEYEECSGQAVRYKMPYCVMVKSAAAGHDLKVQADNFGCKAAARALGFIQPQRSFLDGEDGLRFGIYKDLETAKCSSSHITLCDKKAFGMQLAPLNLFGTEPDVVICFTNPYGAMRFVQAHSYSFGNGMEFRMGGLQAMCSETTAYPYVSGNMNISMLCAGTRNLCKWKEEELAVGIPYLRLEGILTGLLKTVNPLERDEKKKLIQEKLKVAGEDSIEILFGKNYDDNLYEFGKSGRR